MKQLNGSIYISADHAKSIVTPQDGMVCRKLNYYYISCTVIKEHPTFAFYVFVSIVFLSHSIVHKNKKKVS
jgi:hypothetical protein